MSIKSLIETFHKIYNMSEEELLETVFGDKNDDILRSMADELNGCAEVAQDILTKTVSEKDLVILMLMIQKHTVAAAASNNAGASLVIAEMSGEIQAYTQTVILTTIGLLIQDEVL